MILVQREQNKKKHPFEWIYIWGEGWLGFPDLWSGQKPWWNWCLTPVANFGEVRRAQLAKSTPHLLVGASGIFSDAKERVGCGKQREATAPNKSLVKLQPWFLSLRWKTCLRQNCSLGFSGCSEGPAFGQNIHARTHTHTYTYISFQPSPTTIKRMALISHLVCSESQRTMTACVSVAQRRAAHATPVISIPGLWLIAGYTPVCQQLRTYFPVSEKNKCSYCLVHTLNIQCVNVRTF